MKPAARPAVPPSERALARARRMIGGEILPGSADPAGVAELVRTVFPGEDTGDPRFLRWFYEENPSGPALSLISRVSGLVTGHAAIVPQRYKIGAGTVTGSLAVNAITHPEHRGRGIFIVLLAELFRRTVEAGIPFSFGFANDSSFLGCLRHLGYRDLGRLPLWLLPFDPVKLAGAAGGARAAFLRAPAAAAGPVFRLRAALAARRSRSGGLGIERIGETGPDFDELWRRAAGGYENIAVRDSAFAGWRFFRPPTRACEVLGARSGSGRLEGYLAWRKTELMGLPWAMLVDLFIPESDDGERAGRALAGEFVRRAREERAAVAAGLMFARHPAAARALRGAGFLICPRPLLPREFPVLLHWNGPGEPPAGFFYERSWFLTLADYDAV